MGSRRTRLASGRTGPGKGAAGRIELGDPLRVARFHMRNFRLATPDTGDSWSIGELTAANFDLPRYDAAYEGPFRNEVMFARLLGALSVERLEQRDASHTTSSRRDTRRHACPSPAMTAASSLRRSEGLPGEAGQRPHGRPHDRRRHGARRRCAPADRRGVLARLGAGTPIGRVPVAEGRMTGFGGDLMARYGLSLGSVSTETVSEGRIRAAHGSGSRTRARPSLRSVEAVGMRMVMQSMNLREVRVGFDCSTVEDRVRMWCGSRIAAWAVATWPTSPWPRR